MDNAPVRRCYYRARGHQRRITLFKVVWLLKRKPGVTSQQFRDRYERHAKLAQNHFGHLMTGYRRSYVTETRGIDSPPDCVGEWILPNEDALHEINRILAEPLVRKAFDEDMEDFLDRKSAVMVKCDEIDTGTGHSGVV